MMTSNALLIGAGLLMLAGLIMASRRVVSWKLLVITLLIALVSSGASAGVARSRHSGTGVVVSRGYPKPYHFYWRDFEGRGSHRGMNGIYFAANTFVHLGAVGIVAALVPRRRDQDGPSLKMPGTMVFIRITLGVVFVILGIIGGFVPIMQGWIFMLLAFLMLFPRTRMAEKILIKAGPRLPRTVRFLRKLGVGDEQPPPGDTMRAE
jgi:hypothetical protein